MFRTNIYLTEAQRDLLDARALAEGTTRAELVRRLLDRGLASCPEGGDPGSQRGGAHRNRRRNALA